MRFQHGLLGKKLNFSFDSRYIEAIKQVKGPGIVENVGLMSAPGHQCLVTPRNRLQA